MYKKRAFGKLSNVFFITVIISILFFLSPPILFMSIGQKTLALPNTTRSTTSPTNDKIIPRSIPTGGYNIWSNGIPGKLNIISIDKEGKLTGAMYMYPEGKIPTNITGYFDNSSGKISFARVLGPKSTDIEVYTGYKFSDIIADCIAGTGPGSCFQHTTLTGTFQSFVGNQTKVIPAFLVHPTSERNTFGWYALHIPLPCPACPK
jgi:hypothetical protein